MSEIGALDALSAIEYRPEPAVIIVADTKDGGPAARTFAERAGCRVACCVGMDEALERLDRHILFDVLILSVERDHGPLLDHLLDAIEAGAEEGRFGSVVAVPEPLIDIVAARTPHPRVRQLCGGSPGDWIVEILAAAFRTPLRLHDAGRDRTPPGLLQLSEEVARIARTLAELSQDEPRENRRIGEAEGGAEALDPAVLRAMIRARRLRDRYFPPDFFADPAWDMLLDLMAARLEGQRVAVSSLCIAAAVPPTTALRWIKTLTDQGIFVRSADPQDGRRVYIALSDKAAISLECYLRTVQRLAPLAI